jgi:pSer/pThr/pTyr-binding forkhead associated (FHA) protein
MAKVILSMDGQVLNEYPLTKERTTIGRRPHNDIAIDNLAISGEHAVIVTILNDSFLEDLGSTNGTMVNGVPVKKHFLQNSDNIELGKYTLKFVAENAGKAAASEDYEKTMILRPGMMAKPAMAQAPAPVIARPPNATQEIPPGLPPAPPERPTAAAPAALASDKKGVVQVLNGANAGRELELVKALTTIGRPGVQVAVITRRPQGYFITHVEGASFPMVNGAPITSEPRALVEHDIVEISGIKMEFFFR